MLERGEIDITPLWHVNTALAAAAGLPIGYVKVQEPRPADAAVERGAVREHRRWYARAGA
jgi:hypothetical protein